MARTPQLPPGIENEGAETRIALALTMIWLVMCAVYILGVPGALAASTSSLLALILTFAGMFFPLVIIWSVARVAANVRSVRAEAAALRAALEELRAAATAAPAREADADDGLRRQLEEIAALTQRTEARLSELAARTLARTGEAPPPRADAPALADGATEPPRDLSQEKLPLAAPEGPARRPITIAEFIKALNFPDNPEDREGFRVLRRAFEERELGRLLQASQDILTLMSQDGIYMDDLTPDLPLPSVWRKFARGERGPSVADLGGIRDRSALTLVKTRMKNDPIFRDAAHHFLRKFDQVLEAFEEHAEDSELDQMAQTRTARAFMLIGKVAGSFD